MDNQYRVKVILIPLIIIGVFVIYTTDEPKLPAAVIAADESDYIDTVQVPMLKKKGTRKGKKEKEKGKKEKDSIETISRISDTQYKKGII